MSSKSENWMPKPLDYERIHESFEGYEGLKIELYLKHLLSKAVTDLTYSEKSSDGRTNVLIGTNLYGNEVCSTLVLNAKVTYNVDFNFINISVGNVTYTEGAMSSIKINKTDQVAITTKFRCIVTGNSGGNTFNETSALPLTFKWYTETNGVYVEDTRLPNYKENITPGNEITVNLGKMFESAFTGKTLGVSYTIDGIQQTKYFSSVITLKSLTLSYAGTYLLRSNIVPNLNLEGLDSGEDVTTYTYEYCLNNTTVLTKLVSGDTLDLGTISEGINSLFVRVVNADKTLVSNDIQIDFIYLKENSELDLAIALATSIPNSINNCDSSKLFTVVTTDKIYGTAKVVVVKSSSLGNLMGLNSYEDAVNSNYVFKEVEFNLQKDDSSKKEDYNTYIEVEGANAEEYIRVFSNNSNTSSTFYSRNVNGGIDLIHYKKIGIINPKNGVSHLLPVTNAILNFTQVNAGNVFTDLNPNLDESDGLQYEMEDNTSLQIFKASSQVFNQPKALLNKAGINLNTGPFTIEMLIKTYDCSDLNDEILSIGNIKLCPNYLYVYRNGEDVNSVKPDLIRNASRADFLKNKKQHILITFDPSYKPSTYSNIYNNLYKAGTVTYNEFAKPYPCLKIYVNGTINRTIQLTALDLQGDSFSLQINPKNSNTNFYVFRTYDKALTYTEIKLNYASTLLRLQDKELFHEINDILYNETDFRVSELESKKDIINTISLGKCLNKFKSVSDPNKSYINRRVLLLALPEGIKPPYYGNRKEDKPKAAYLVNYPNDPVHSGRLSGGKVSPQGSSAKKYIIHNPSYSGFTFVPESEWKNADYPGVDYYTLPYDNIPIKKIVGKVNYASSMQSHKQGATKLFHDGYMNMCGTTISTDWMNGGRKAVLEDDFLYFYVNVPEEDLDKLTWDYFKDSDGNYNFENCHFLGFQTWGSGKGDKATSGYDEKTPYYLMLEGADNANASANFKTPWAAMQCWEDPTSVDSKFKLFSGKDSQGNPDYLTGLLINDETIVYNPGREQENSTDKRADAWDVDFGATKYKPHYNEDENPVFEFEDKAKVSLNRFAEFFNYIYKFDFSSLIFIPNKTTVDITSDVAEGTTIVNGVSTVVNTGAQTYNKLVFGDDCYITINGNTQAVNPGDIYRWEKGWEDGLNAPTESKWVPAGLYYTNNSWESLNIYDICNEYTMDSNSFFSSSDYNHLRSKFANEVYKYFGKQQSHTPYNPDFGKVLIKIMAEAFKIIVSEYMDVNDVTYHQAFIRLISGTDNRAKNTYFLIVGPINPDETYEITKENLTKDFKIRLYQDDLDTIFKTDNNGQQVKPYYLLEPPFNTSLKELWGDLRSGLFHNLDIVFVDDIKNKLKELLEFSTNGNWPDSENTKFYEYFLSIQKGIPEIAYNHHSEIFYESAATLWYKSEPTEFYTKLRESDSKNWKDFSNNQVASPLSLSHGSCYDAEAEYLKDRILFLSTYAGGGKTSTDVGIRLGSTSSTSYASQYVVNSDYTSFIQYIYPTICGLLINSEVSSLNYDSVIDLVSEDKNNSNNPPDTTENLVYNVAVPGNYLSINFNEKREGLTSGTKWENTDLYRTVYIKNCVGVDDVLTFPNANTVICQSSEYKINVGENTEIKVSDYMKAVEHLILHNADIKSSGLNFTGCNKLKTLILGKTSEIIIPDLLNTNNTITINAGEDCTGFNKVILPNSNTLETLVLPSNIESLTVGYYPNLSEISIGHSIKSLIIDGRNSQEVLEELLNSLVTGPGSSLYITNIPELGIWLDESLCSKLAYVEDIHVEGTINVGLQPNYTTISFNTKKLLVEKFGNIDSISNKVCFKYTTKNISTVITSTTATIQNSGPAPINLNVDGNNVKIEGNLLKVKYELLTTNNTTVNSPNININPITGYLTIAEGHEGSYIIKVTVWYGNTSKSSSTNLTVGFYVPKVGDFAYANGTFNLTYDSSLDLVGMVYNVLESGNDYKVWVLGNEVINGIMGPSHHLGSNDYDFRKQRSGFYLSIFGGNSIDDNNLLCYSDLDRNNQNLPSGTIYYDTPSINTFTAGLATQTNEALQQRQHYISIINEYTSILKDKIPNFPNANQLNLDLVQNEDIDVYNELYTKLYNTNEIVIDSNNTYYKSDGVDFTICLYPAIMNTLYYEPENLSGKGSDYYKRGVWYVPTMYDIGLLLHLRINSARSNIANTQQLWNSTKKGSASGNLSSDIFSEITFFKTEQYCIKASNCAPGGYAYTYQHYYYNDAPQWVSYPSYNDYPYRDIQSAIYPCCCINISK